MVQCHHRYPLLLLILILSACSPSDNDLKFATPDIPVPEALMEIYSPTNGSVLPANTPFVLEYDVVRGAKGRYVEIQIDKQQPALINQTYGKHFIDALPAGSHTITLTEFSQQGEPTGGFAVIHITME